MARFKLRNSAVTQGLNTAASMAFFQSAKRVMLRLTACRVLKPNLLPILSLAALPIVSFPAAVSLQGYFSAMDLQFYFFPYRTMAAEMVKSGSLPLWNPYAFGGIPLIGDGQTALFFPPNWLFFVLPPHWAHNYGIILQFWIASIGAYLLARTLNLSRGAAFIAAASYSMSGFMVARVVHLSIMGGAALLPLIFLCVERAFRTSRLGWSVLASLCVAMQVFTGHPQPVVYTGLALALYALVIAFSEGMSVSRLVLCLGHLTAIYLLGFTFAAIQLLPWIELAGFSPRAAFVSPERLFGTSGRLADIFLLVFPYLFGSLTSGPYESARIETATQVRLWEHSVYVGILPLFLALLALLERFSDHNAIHTPNGDVDDISIAQLERRRQMLLYFSLLGVLSLVVATASPTLVGRLLYVIPILNKLRCTERIGLLLVFALAMLASFAYDGLVNPKITHQGHGQRIAQFRSCTLVFLVIVLLSIAMQLPQLLPYFGVTAAETANFNLVRPNWYVATSLIVATSLLLYRAIGRIPGRAVKTLLMGLVCIDLIGFAAFFQPLSESSEFIVPPVAGRVLSADKGVFRKATILGGSIAHNLPKHTLGMSWSMVYGIEDIDGFNSLQPRRHVDLVLAPDREDISYGQLAWRRDFSDKQAILDLLNVKYVVVPHADDRVIPKRFRLTYSDSLVDIYANPNYYRRAFFVEKVVEERDSAAILRKLRSADFDARRIAFVEDSSSELVELPQPICCDDVNIIGRTADTIYMQTSTSTRRFLFLSEMHFPGWRAYIDGRETRIYRTNYLFRGVIVPPGVHAVDFRYRPSSVNVGAFLSASSAFLVAVVVWWYVRRPRKKMDCSSPN